MKKASSKNGSTADMRAEYDFSGGVRGKYAERFARGVNIVLIDSDLAEAFPDSKSVNRALRILVEAAQMATAPKRRRTRAS